MVEQPVSKSLFKDETKYESLNLGGATCKLDRDVMLDIFDETFAVSSVERVKSTDQDGFNMTDMLSQWFKGESRAKDSPMSSIHV